MSAALVFVAVFFGVVFGTVAGVFLLALIVLWLDEKHSGGGGR